MDRQEKEKFVADLHNQLEKARGTFLLDYKGLDVEALSRLRAALRDVDAEFRVVKNRLLKLASKGTDAALMEEKMEGPSAITLSYDDLVAPAKVLVNFGKDFSQLKFKAAQIEGQSMDAGEVERLAELPGREVLLAQVLSAMQAVPASLLRVLNGVLVSLLNVLKAIEQQKETSA